MIGKIMLGVIMILVLGAGEVRAAAFNVEKIGNVDVTGKQSSHWWYSGLQPIISGEATLATQVTVTVDGTVSQVNVDSSGDWFYTPAAGLSVGDHTVSLENNGSIISFTLTLGNENVDWTAVGNGAGEALPAAGVTLPTVLMMMGGGALIFGGKKLFFRS